VVERIRVRNVYPLAAADRGLLERVDSRLEFVHEGEDTSAWAASLRDPDVQIIIGSYPPPDLEATPRLRWLVTAGAGVDYLVPTDPWGHGLTVTNGSGLHAVHIAEYVLGAALFARQRVVARLVDHVAHRWASDTDRMSVAGQRLRGTTAAIIGYGSIGREVARLLHAFGVRILALKANPHERIDTGWREVGTGDIEGLLPARFAGPNELLHVVAQADLVVLTLPGTLRTAGLVDAQVLAAMRPDAWLVNVGRGSLVDESALAAALRAGRIGGAVLDVTVAEPLPPESPLWDLPDCLVTAHISGTGDVDELWHQSALLFAENLRRDLVGETLLNITSGATGY